MSKKLFFAISTILLAAPIFAFTSCQPDQRDSDIGKLAYGQSVNCQSKQEIDNLFQNNKDQWPQTSKINYSNLEKNPAEHIMYFDLIASICKCSNDKNIIGFSLTWNSEKDNINELTLTYVNDQKTTCSSSEYKALNNKVVLSLISNQSDITIPSFAYANVVIE